MFCRHTSASLLIQENAAREVRSDLEAFFESLAPEDSRRYAHDDEGPDDMPAHLRTALTGVHLSIPVIEGRLALGRGKASICSSTAGVRTSVRLRCTCWVSEARAAPASGVVAREELPDQLARIQLIDLFDGAL